MKYLPVILFFIILSGCNPNGNRSKSEAVKSDNKVKRYGTVTKVVPEKLEEYKRLHAAAWPGVLEMIKKCNIRNYSIYYKDGYLFSYYEYIGDDFNADMAKMAADPETQRWWSVTTPCLQPLETAAPGEVWAVMEEIFHTE